MLSRSVQVHMKDWQEIKLLLPSYSFEKNKTDDYTAVLNIEPFPCPWYVIPFPCPHHDERLLISTHTSYDHSCFSTHARSAPLSPAGAFDVHSCNIKATFRNADAARRISILIPRRAYVSICFWSPYLHLETRLLQPAESSLGPWPD